MFLKHKLVKAQDWEYKGVQKEQEYFLTLSHMCLKILKAHKMYIILLSGVFTYYNCIKQFSLIKLHIVQPLFIILQLPAGYGGR